MSWSRRINRSLPARVARLEFTWAARRRARNSAKKPNPATPESGATSRPGAASKLPVAAAPAAAGQFTKGN